MSLLGALTFFHLWVVGLGVLKVEQSQISISTVVKKSIDIYCSVSSRDFENEVIHWYRLKPNQALEHLLYITSTKNPTRSRLGEKDNKVEARKVSHSSTSIFTIHFIEEEDVAIYYCAGCYDRKLFGGGTKLIVTDKSLDADLSPKPTIFLPSVSETIEHKAGTYLCLLEKFFPDVIKVDWKEKNSNRILESQQGHTIKTGDTFMKFSWLTVTEKSWDKDHQCVVKHENIKEADKMILFPSIKRGLEDGVIGPTPSPGDAAGSDPVQSGKGADIALTNSTKACLKDEDDTLQLQLTNTSAYYTYLLLLLKSAVYLAMVVFCLLRRTEVCGDGKSS
ncbi:T-cell receptor gamma alternate reading frame protein isoform X1 [Loxodonta africana]|uniref:T-cell receptor gamma alternate reading frame protein isoform X1 n=1 Tax=Loxodonta africana TaxID=9785 RepID=UPI0030D53F74